MDTDEVQQLLALLRRTGGEPARIEAKSAAGGVPRSARATLSSFSNTDGGTLLLGVDESSGFAVVRLPDVVRLRDAIIQMSRDDLTPPLQVSVGIVEVEEALLLVVDVPPARSDQRPVYVTSQGIVNGSYLRTGDGDRRMSEAEIAMLYSSRSQPLYDMEPIEGTTAADLDRDALLRTLQRTRSASPSFLRASEVTVLHRLGVLAEADDQAPLTLAGLMVFGEYPQQTFPQLMVSVVVHPPEGDSGSQRFLDNVSLRGSIPDMVSGSLSVLRRNLAARAVMTETGRTERIEYPLEAIREALVNALMHRDYSPATRGTQVQVDLYPDRLVVRSPGGLYGGVVVDDLGEVGISSSRNGVMASLLSDAFLPGSAELVAENRSSGIPTMLDLARASGLPRPAFASSVTSFVVTMSRSELLGPEARRWISTLRARLPTPAHEIALAMMRGGYVTNASLRQWGVDRITAGEVLRDLVDQGLATKEGGRRYARYVLDVRAAPGRARSDAAPDLFTNHSTDVSAELRGVGSATAADLQQATGMSRSTVHIRLKELLREGLAASDGAPNSPKRRYRWTGEA